MDFQTYLEKFDELLKSTSPVEPYTDPDYFDYAKLNFSRTKRWLKVGVINENTLAAIHSIQEPQTWIILTEFWCGDAAHSVPFLEMMAKQNPLITTSYEFRDAEPNRIEEYLTNGTKSIPKLIVRNEEGEDLFVWGPRPAECHAYFQKSIEDHSDFEKVKEVIQAWYNQDKGQSIQEEILQLIQASVKA